MKVIFLDIDGVLNCKQTPNPRKFPFIVDSVLLDRLNRLLGLTGAKVVLTSNWRYDPAGMFSAKHYGIPFVDTTPDLPNQPRCNPIVDWLRPHPDVERFIVIDDEDDELDAFPLFQPSRSTGLTDDIMQGAADYLNGKTKKDMRRNKLFAYSRTSVPWSAVTRAERSRERKSFRADDRGSAIYGCPCRNWAYRGCFCLEKYKRQEPYNMFGKVWGLLKDTASGFSNDEVMSRAAAIAYFTIFSIAPLLLIVIAIAGLVFGRDAAQAAIMGQFSGLMGKGSGDALQSMLQSAGSQSQKSGTIATIIGVVTLLITASGAFGEIQSALNKIWKAEPKAGLTRLVRARIASMGLVMTLGFLLVISLVLSAGIAAFGHWVEGVFPGAKVLMAVVNFVITLALLSVVFAAIYKFLPDKPIAWRDVLVGAVVTAILFTIGKSLIGIYIGSTKVAESYGTAGSLIVILVWIYYSTVTFLVGAEFTRSYAERFGSHVKRPALAASPDALARQAGVTRADMDQTWRIIRGRVPEPPTLPAKRADGSVAEARPSWLQLAVAGLAIAVLPRHNRDHAGTTSRIMRDHEHAAAPRSELRPQPERVPAE